MLTTFSTKVHRCGGMLSYKFMGAWGTTKYMCKCTRRHCLVCEVAYSCHCLKCSALISIQASMLSAFNGRDIRVVE